MLHNAFIVALLQPRFMTTHMFSMISALEVDLKRAGILEKTLVMLSINLITSALASDRYTLLL